MESKKRGYHIDLCIRDIKEEEYLKYLAQERERRILREKKEKEKTEGHK